MLRRTAARSSILWDNDTDKYITTAIRKSNVSGTAWCRVHNTLDRLQSMAIYISDLMRTEPALSPTIADNEPSALHSDSQIKAQKERIVLHTVKVQLFHYRRTVACGIKRVTQRWRVMCQILREHKDVQSPSFGGSKKSIYRLRWLKQSLLLVRSEGTYCEATCCFMKQTFNSI